jgi:putative transposase
MRFQEIQIAPCSPWQDPFVERLIESIHSACLDHVIGLHERHLQRILSDYFRYYRRWRTHRALEMDYPETRAVQKADGDLLAEIPEIGGLHHHYERIAA